MRKLICLVGSGVGLFFMNPVTAAHAPDFGTDNSAHLQVHMEAALARSEPCLTITVSNLFIAVEKTEWQRRKIIATFNSVDPAELNSWKLKLYRVEDDNEHLLSSVDLQGMRARKDWYFEPSACLYGSPNSVCIGMVSELCQGKSLGTQLVANPVQFRLPSAGTYIVEVSATYDEVSVTEMQIVDIPVGILSICN